ncbi:uncharacterized protein LOC143301803 isoform X2 [Babylonia areolata]|uniref:uncharacterized protein LOC143301803 isoform X2 n=1 Tax=Babylonia areolata TaxID=304850 RepID=UPI003FD4418D
MALQGKVFHNLCRSVWRVKLSGSTGHRDLLNGSVAALGHQRQLSSLPQRPLSASSQTSPPPPPPLPCFHTEETGSSVSLHKKTQKKTSVEVEGQCYQKEADTKVDISSSFSSLCLHADVKPRVSVKGGWGLASWPSRDHMEYVCPSEKSSALPELVILEQLPLTTPSYDLPQTSAIVSHIIDPASNSSAEISEPTSSETTNAPKEARMIMKIRRKKMKRHLLKKFRKRMAFTLRKMKRDRRKKKEAVFQARLAKIKDWGESFNARDWVQQELDKARKGGFFINVLERK